MAPWQIEYEQKLEDWAAWAGWTRFYSPTAKRGWRQFLIFVIAVTVFGIAPGILLRDIGLIAFSALAAIVPLGFVLLYPSEMLRSWQTSRNLKKITSNPTLAKQLTTTISVTLTDKGIQQTAGGAMSFTPWDRIHKTEMSDGLCIIFYSPISGLPIPRRAFPDQDSFERFYAPTKNLIDSARG
jgi:hypothetical protein